jgi:hypothetical protein
MTSTRLSTTSLSLSTTLTSLSTTSMSSQRLVEPFNELDEPLVDLDETLDDPDEPLSDLVEPSMTSTRLSTASMRLSTTLWIGCEIQLVQEGCRNLGHVLVPMHKTGASLGGSRRDERVDKGKPLRSLASDVEGGEGHLLVRRDDLVQEAAVVLHDLASLRRRGIQIQEPTGKFGEGHTGCEDLGVTVLEQGLDALPARFLAVVGKHRRRVEQEAHGDVNLP